MVLVTSHHSGWQTSQEARHLGLLKDIYKLAYIPANSIQLLFIDGEGKEHRYTQKFPYELTIWLLHTPKVKLLSRVNRNQYFSSLKCLRRELNRKLCIHPILNFGNNYHEHLNHIYTDTISDLIDKRRRILNISPIDWDTDTYHEISAEILSILPNVITSHSNIARMLELSELNTNSLKDTYFKKGAYIYGIFNFNSHQSCTYIGQTRMRKRRVADRRKEWKELERAPLQRMREHIQAALSNVHHKESKTTKLYRYMKYDPAAWIMIPLAVIPTRHRSKAIHIEDRWWSTFFPNTYNDQPPNGTLINNACTSKLEAQIYRKINNLSLAKLLKIINSNKLKLSTLECIAALTKLKKYLNISDKYHLLSIIKSKSRSINLSNIRLSWKFIIPLQTKNKFTLYKKQVSTLIHKLNCPSIIKNFIKDNTHLYFRPTRRIIDLVRMDRDHSNNLSYKDIQHPITNSMNAHSGDNPEPSCNCECHNLPGISGNQLGHTFIRTDKPEHLSNLLKNIPELSSYCDKEVVWPFFQGHND